MSADNWGQCPKCLSKANADRKAADKKLAALYGTVSAEKYIEEVQTHAAIPKVPNVPDSLHEDYKIRITKDGVFCVGYSAGCCTPGCGFTFKFKEEKMLTF